MVTPFSDKKKRPNTRKETYSGYICNALKQWCKKVPAWFV